MLQDAVENIAAQYSAVEAHALFADIATRSIDEAEILPAQNQLTIVLHQMVRDQVLSQLRAHEAELRAAGILRLSLFGSAARDEVRPDSDIDLLAEFDDSRELSLLDVIGIENKLADLLGRRVDLVEEGTLKPRVRRSVEREIIRAF